MEAFRIAGVLPPIATAPHAIGRKKHYSVTRGLLKWPPSVANSIFGHPLDVFAFGEYGMGSDDERQNEEPLYGGIIGQAKQSGIAKRELKIKKERAAEKSLHHELISKWEPLQKRVEEFFIETAGLGKFIENIAKKGEGAGDLSFKWSAGLLEDVVRFNVESDNAEFPHTQVTIPTMHVELIVKKLLLSEGAKSVEIKKSYFEDAHLNKGWVKGQYMHNRKYVVKDGPYHIRCLLRDGKICRTGFERDSDPVDNLTAFYCTKTGEMVRRRNDRTFKDRLHEYQEGKGMSWTLYDAFKGRGLWNEMGSSEFVIEF